MQELRLENKIFTSTLYTLYGILITYPLIFLEIYAYQLSGIIAAVMIYSISSLAMGIAPLLVAPLSDRTGYRLRYAILAILVGSIFLLASTLVEQVSLVIVLMIIGSAILQIGQPLFIAFETERREKVGRSVGDVYLFINLGYFIGSVVYGYFIEILSFKVTSISTSLIGVVISTLFLPMKENRIHSDGSKHLKIWDTLKSMDKVIVFSSILAFGPALVYSIIPIYYTNLLRGGVLDWGVVNAFATLIGIFVSPYVGKLIDSIGIRMTLAIGAAYYPIYYLSIILYPNTIFFAIIYALPFWLFVWIPLFTLPALYSTNEERARKVSSMNFSIDVFRALGGVAGGSLYYLLDPYTFIIISALISTILPIFSLQTIKLKK
ncbi:MAG TPA: MFS transporter [Geobacterales bacterium]|nr:MFS transporter [Geobacterales bacterium]